MKKIVVLGCGLVGRVMAQDLSAQHDVTSVDISAKNLEKITSKNITKKCLDVSDKLVFDTKTGALLLVRTIILHVFSPVIIDFS